MARRLPSDPRPRRPRGIAALALLLVALGVLTSLPFLAFASAQVAGGNYLGGLLTALIPQALIVGGVGLWLLKRWGVYVTVTVALLFGFFAARQLVSAPTQEMITRVGVVLVVVAGLLFYLTRPHVKAAFGAPVVGSASGDARP